MTASNIKLESFDTEISSASLSVTADYQRGFDDGVAKAGTSIAAQHAKGLTDIAATLGDMAFGYAEARGELLDQIQPLLAQIAETIIPALAQETFATHLIETLDRAFTDVTDQVVNVAVTPDMVAVLGELEPTFNIVPDPKLSPGQARLRRDDTHFMIDLPALVTALQAALQGLEATQRTHING